jgi:tRNA pseudouridine55 synthase
MPQARPRGRDVFGLLLLDKPMGWSSNRALQWVKRLYRAAKAGHGGSLDPLATGMLPIFFGGATRLCGYLLEAPKQYRVTAMLGTATTTGDADGELTVDRSSAHRPVGSELEPALARFRGAILQVPPMYSALKRDGVPLYRLARQGVEVERAPRQVTIDVLTVEGYEWPELRLTVHCSKGTYIRTLVEDIAAALGTVGHVGALRRLGVAPFVGRAMHTVEDLEGLAACDAGLSALDAELLPADQALPDWPAVTLDATLAARFCQGQRVPFGPCPATGAARVYAEHGAFIGIGTIAADGRLAPDRVFPR